MLNPPPYIPVEQLRSAPVRHKWSNWDPYELLPDPPEDTKTALTRVSELAVIAYAIGCAEWVAYRFSKEELGPLPFHFLEACWAWVMTPNLIYPTRLGKDEDWQGPARGATDLALLTAANTIESSLFLHDEDAYTEEDHMEDEDLEKWLEDMIEEEERESKERGGKAEEEEEEADGDEDDEEGDGGTLSTLQAAFAEAVAHHVLPKEGEDAFMAWREQVLERLVALYPREEADPWGPPVPREALDPTIELTPETQQRYVEAFLARIDPKNPFIVYMEEGATNR